MLTLFLMLVSGCTMQIAHKETRQPSPREKAAFQLTQDGKQLLEEGKTENAIRLLEQAIGLNPDSGQTYYYLARAWLEKGVFSEAKEFNDLAQIYLQDDKQWMIRVKKQADQITRLKK